MPALMFVTYSHVDINHTDIERSPGSVAASPVRAWHFAGAGGSSHVWDPHHSLSRAQRALNGRAGEDELPQRPLGGAEAVN